MSTKTEDQKRQIVLRRKPRGRSSATIADGQLALNLRQTAICLGVSEMSVRRLVKRGLLKPSRALRTLVFSRKEIERYLDATTE